MAKFKISLNMEFCRSADKSFEAGVRIASELGYRWVEPMVHTGWELLSEVNYFHSFSMEEDPLLMKEICDRYGMKVSSLSAHSPLMKPEAAVDRLTRAAVLASFVGCDFLNSDEMVKPDWMDDAFAHDTMRYTLTRRRRFARGTGSFSASNRTAFTPRPPTACSRSSIWCHSPWIQVNWDTGNSYLAGVEDPYEGLAEGARPGAITSMPRTSRWPTATRSAARSPAPRSAAPAARAWSIGNASAKIMEPVDREIFLSVECGKIDEAERSISYLNKALAKWLA